MGDMSSTIDCWDNFNEETSKDNHVGARLARRLLTVLRKQSQGFIGHKYKGVSLRKQNSRLHWSQVLRSVI